MALPSSKTKTMALPISNPKAKANKAKKAKAKPKPTSSKIALIYGLLGIAILYVCYRQHKIIRRILKTEQDNNNNSGMLSALDEFIEQTKSLDGLIEQVNQQIDVAMDVVADALQEEVVPPQQIPAPLPEGLTPLRRAVDYDLYTVRINTWKRERSLKVVVHHLLTCPNIAQIQIVWCIAQGPVPIWLDQLAQVPYPRNAANITQRLAIEQHEDNSLNARFNLINGAPTVGILSQDDDLLRPCESMDAGFAMWTLDPARMVGFEPRKHKIEYDEATQKETWAYHYKREDMLNRYSMVLTKYAFIHKDYLHTYTAEMPAVIRDKVTDYLNCEDIAMALWVASKTNGLTPLLADRWAEEQTVITLNAVQSISDHSQHIVSRGVCVEEFANILNVKSILQSDVFLLEGARNVSNFLECGATPRVNPPDAETALQWGFPVVSRPLRDMLEKRHKWRQYTLDNEVPLKHYLDGFLHTVSRAAVQDECFFRGDHHHRDQCGKAKGACYFELPSCGPEHYEQKYQAYHRMIPEGYHYIFDVATVEDFPKTDKAYRASQCKAFADSKMLKNKFEHLKRQAKCEWQIFAQSKDARRQVPYAIRAGALQYEYVPHDISLVTQGSVDRMERLRVHAKFWQGPISAAIYIRNMTEISHVYDFVKENHVLLSQTTVHLFFEKQHKTEHGAHYPHNYLRNTALNFTDTEYVVIVDMDFMTNKGAHDGLKKLIATNDEVKWSLDNRVLMVLPAFEYTKHGKRKLGKFRDYVPSSKSVLLRYVNETVTPDGMHNNYTDGIMEPFHITRFGAGHNTTNFTKWIAHDSGPMYMLTKKYNHHFEPYVLAKREGLPFYWAGFRGFGENKVSWFRDAHVMEFTYGALRDFFVFHVGRRSRMKFVDELLDVQRPLFYKYLDDKKKHYQHKLLRPANEVHQEIKVNPLKKAK